MSDNPLDTKTCQIVKYLVSRLPGRLGKTKIVKLLYLADLESRRLMGKPISEMRYRWYNHGPWDERVDVCLKALTEAKSIEVEIYPMHGWYGSLYHNLGGNIDSGLSQAEKRILDYLIQEYGQKKLKELLEEIVYETTPMKDVRERKAFNEFLRMELVDNELRAAFGDVDFEDLVAGENDILEGRSTPLSEVLSELEHRNSSEGTR